jgi:hypothetical protein
MVCFVESVTFDCSVPRCAVAPDDHGQIVMADPEGNELCVER